MFTGIVEETGIVTNSNSSTLEIQVSDSFLQDIKIGDSIAVDGVCLTVDSIEKDLLIFKLSQETLELVTFNKNLNLEKALSFNSRLGGSIVSGHVHTQAIFIQKDENYNFWFELEPFEIIHVNYKSSVTVNGVNLTVSEIIDNTFKVSLIPKTLEITNIGCLIPNQKVNIEFENYSIDFMETALTLSEKFIPSPNPHVGCVIVKNNRIISWGVHEKFGGNHAEINALRNIQNLEDTENCILYVTLEPCNHWGKTPPCCEAIIESGIKSVIIGMLDPDPIVSGKGMDYLISKGIKVTLQNNEKVNFSLRAYTHHRIHKSCYVSAKIAESVDGSISTADNTSKWITGNKTRDHSHLLFRNRVDCIMIGSKTVLQDDPSLTVRTKNTIKRIPIVLIDSENKIDKNYKIFESPVIHFTRENSKLKNGKIVLEFVLEELYKKNFIHILVEGGKTLQSELYNQKLLNELVVYTGNCLLGDYSKRWGNMFCDGINNNLELSYHEKINNDFLRVYSISQKKNFIQEFDDIEDALQDFRSGKFVIVMDDESRENEGDLIVAGEDITESQMTLLIEHTTGIICTPITKELSESLKLPPMVVNNQDSKETAFTVSTDSINVSTGVSSEDRVATVKDILSGDSSKLTRPGHMYPLIAKNILVRRGHTESGVALCELTGKKQVAVIGELTRDGEMMRFTECYRFAKAHGLKIINITQLVEYYKKNISFENHECSHSTECNLMIKDKGEWRFLYYPPGHRVLIKGEINGIIPVRIHSECFTGDVLNSELCDCGPQLQNSIDYIYKNNSGIIILPYNHEGRGIGLENKIKAYKLIRDEGLDTYEANRRLGFKDDERDYKDCKLILENLGVKRIELLTDNKGKIEAMGELVEKVTNIRIKPSIHNRDYLEIKSETNGYEKKILRSLPFKEIKKKNIAIVSAYWHDELLGELRNNLEKKLQENKCEIDYYTVPGSLELVSATDYILRFQKQNFKSYDCVIWLGILVKGDTKHFEIVSEGVMKGLIDLQLKYNIPIIDGVLNCTDISQAVDRVKNMELTNSLAISSVYMAGRHYL